MKTALVLIAALFSIGAACRPIREDSGSAFASEAGQSTIVLGACSSEFNLGWSQCLLTKGVDSFPTLRFVVTNPAEWAVSDCGLGLYRTGAAEAPGVVEVDLSGLKDQATKIGMCILKIETVERYKDPRDGDQLRSVFMRGGFFIEMIEPGFMPVPANDVLAFCVKVMRTTKGRTKVEQCKP